MPPRPGEMDCLATPIIPDQKGHPPFFTHPQPPQDGGSGLRLSGSARPSDHIAMPSTRSQNSRPRAPRGASLRAQRSTTLGCAPGSVACHDTPDDCILGRHHATGNSDLCAVADRVMPRDGLKQWPDEGRRRTGPSGKPKPPRGIRKRMRTAATRRPTVPPAMSNPLHRSNSIRTIQSGSREQHGISAVDLSTSTSSSTCSPRSSELGKTKLSSNARRGTSVPTATSTG